MNAIFLNKFLTRFTFYANMNRSFPPAAKNFIRETRGVTWNVRKRMHSLHILTVGIAVLIAGILFLFYMTIPYHPNGNEILLSLSTKIGFWAAWFLHVGLIGTGAFALFGWAVSNLKKGIILTRANDQDAPLSLTMGHVIFVFSDYPGDNTFPARLQDAKDNLLDGQFIVQASFRSPTGSVYTVNDGLASEEGFRRETPQ